MPVYPDINLIFVHIPKTAGGALTRALEPWRSAATPTPINRILAHLPYAQPVDKLALGTHDSAAWMKRKLGVETFDRLTKFTVVRNPYDRLISEYEFIRQADHHHRQDFVNGLSFQQFLKWRKKKGIAQSALITDRSGRILVDKVIQFERLQPDLDVFFSDNNVPITLPANKGLNSSEKSPKSDYLTAQTVQIINDEAAMDFELLEYDRISA